jgi:hypothetical protein
MTVRKVIGRLALTENSVLDMGCSCLKIERMPSQEGKFCGRKQILLLLRGSSLLEPAKKARRFQSPPFGVLKAAVTN